MKVHIDGDVWEVRLPRFDELLPKQLHEINKKRGEDERYFWTDDRKELPCFSGKRAVPCSRTALGFIKTGESVVAAFRPILVPAAEGSRFATDALDGIPGGKIIRFGSLSYGQNPIRWRKNGTLLPAPTLLQLRAKALSLIGTAEQDLCFRDTPEDEDFRLEFMKAGNMLVSTRNLITGMDYKDFLSIWTPDNRGVTVTSD